MGNSAIQKPAESGPESVVVRALGGRSIVLIGMMGAGKSSIGRRLASRLGIPFIDADAEIESAAGMTIPSRIDRGDLRRVTTTFPNRWQDRPRGS